MVDIAPIFAHAFTGDKGHALEAIRETLIFSGASRERPLLRLGSLLCVFCASTGCTGCGKQLVHYAARRCEAVLWKSLHEHSPSPKALQAARVDLLALMWKNKQLDFQLLRYLESGLEKTCVHRSLALSFDKANVGGLTLGNSFITTPGNDGFVGPPQASASRLEQ